MLVFPLDIYMYTHVYIDYSLLSECFVRCMLSAMVIHKADLTPASPVNGLCQKLVIKNKQASEQKGKKM